MIRVLKGQHIESRRIEGDQSRRYSPKKNWNLKKKKRSKLQKKKSKEEENDFGPWKRAISNDFGPWRRSTTN